MTLSHYEKAASPATFADMQPAPSFYPGGLIQNPGYPTNIGQRAYFAVTPSDTSNRFTSNDQRNWGVKLYIPARNPRDVPQVVSMLAPFGASGERANARAEMARRVLTAGCVGILAFPADGAKYDDETYANSLATINRAIATSLPLDNPPLTVYDHPLTEHLTPAFKTASGVQGFNEVYSTTYGKGDDRYFGTLGMAALLARQPLAIEGPKS